MSEAVPHSSALLSGWVDSFPLGDDGIQLESDLFGIRRIFYALGDGLVHAGSTARMVKLAAGLPDRLDPIRVRRAVRGQFQQGSSLYAGIFKLRPGFSLRLRPQGLWLGRTQVSPDFLPWTAAVDAESSARQLKVLLKAAVTESFSPGKTAFLLSGGLDSAALLTIAAEAGLSPLYAYTFHTGLPGDEAEIARAEAIATLAGAQLTTVRIVPEELPDILPAAVRSMEDVAWSPLPAAKFQAFNWISVDGFDRVISGLGADEILAGDPPSLRAFAPAGSSTPLASGQARVFREILPELTVPAEVRPAQAHGVSVFAPFLHPAIVSFASGLPMHLRTDGNLGKLILRWAVRSLLPDEIRLQKKVPRPLSLSAAPESVRTAWQERFSELAADEESLLLAGISQAELHTHLSSLREGPYAMESERMLFRLHSLRVLAGRL